MMENLQYTLCTTYSTTNKKNDGVRKKVSLLIFREKSLYNLEVFYKNHMLKVKTLRLNIFKFNRDLRSSSLGHQTLKFPLLKKRQENKLIFKLEKKKELKKTDLPENGLKIYIIYKN